MYSSENKIAKVIAFIPALNEEEALEHAIDIYRKKQELKKKIEIKEPSIESEVKEI